MPLDRNHRGVHLVFYVRGKVFKTKTDFAAIFTRFADPDDRSSKRLESPYARSQ